MKKNIIARTGRYIKRHFLKWRVKHTYFKSVYDYILDSSRKTLYDITLLCHTIEKNICINHSELNRHAFTELINHVETLMSSNNNYCFDFYVRYSIGLMSNYCDDKDVSDRVALLKKNYSINPLSNVGVKDVDVVVENDLAKHFLQSRHSVRWTTNELVDEKTILNMIQLANNAPSACNRQPWKVLYSTSIEGNKSIKQFVPDSMVRNNITNFMIVGCDKYAFNANEKMQFYINGGIFLHSLLLSLHAFGFGATMFQCPTLLDANSNFRKKFNLDEGFVVVGIIGFGYIDYSKKILCADRKRAEDISTNIDGGNDE